MGVKNAVKTCKTVWVVVLEYKGTMV